MTKVTQAEIDASAKSDNRVTPRAINEAIKATRYYYDDLLTIAVLELWNGFKLIGQSACVDPANYNKELGERLAREDAVRQVWAFLGFEILCKLAESKE